MLHLINCIRTVDAFHLLLFPAVRSLTSVARSQSTDVKLSVLPTPEFENPSPPHSSAATPSVHLRRLSPVCVAAFVPPSPEILALYTTFRQISSSEFHDWLFLLTPTATFESVLELFVSEENFDSENDDDASQDRKLEDASSNCISDPLRMYSWPWDGCIKSSSDRSCHTYPFLYRLKS